jgi:pyridoxamine 5'-phosphate oxidase
LDRVARLRKEYTRAGLKEPDTHPNPIEQFRTWFDEALAANLHEPNAMTLATSTPHGRPSVRVVLLKGFDERGFVFYTNYEGRKGEELEANPYCALLFYWGELERQVRVEGRVGRLPDEESDAYFAGRPRGSQLGAWASEQSRPVKDRAPSTNVCASSRPNTRVARCRARLSGVVTASSRRSSSSGRGARTACTTA